MCIQYYTIHTVTRVKKDNDVTCLCEHTYINNAYCLMETMPWNPPGQSQAGRKFLGGRKQVRTMGEEKETAGVNC